MQLLAIDLGKFKSVACLYRGDDDTEFRTIETRPQVIHDLLTECEPERLVVEVGTVTGWVHDLAAALGIEVQVANPNTEGWRWRRVKRKTDRDDALKLARLSAAGQLPTVWMPKPRVRQWRSLIHYRHALVSRRTAIRNNIRSVLDAQGLGLAMGKKAWTEEGMLRVAEIAKPIVSCSADELWRGQLDVEATLLVQLQSQLQAVEDRLDALAATDARTARLRTIPGVGPRLSEAVVAWVDDPERFRNARAVGSYVGLVPRRRQSGTYDRSGRVTKQGPSLLRKLLVEVAWIMRQHNPHAEALFRKLSKGSGAGTSRRWWPWLGGC
ncbi:IS110 family RNA-guided transposase [Mucisphaera calidilacus]|uniref:Transposase IS116/IS110/IS902 family protein n=1 Tax=Mucisphaera calidilacus TaxID=2527982 RepID=A0A518C093_9BACT|nr:IS110 family transposase [Mucisphaera calidilacus]QDU72637.1 Transposase IS116/IS110/IS902 family protein [Mucisphaera calidilacus]